MSSDQTEFEKCVESFPFFFSGSRDASRADKSPHETRRSVRLQREFVQYASYITTPDKRVT